MGKIKNITKEMIYNSTIEIYEKNNRDISRFKLFRLVGNSLGCREYTIINRCGSFDDILNYLNINIPKNYCSLESKKNIDIGVHNSKKWRDSMLNEERNKKISMNVKIYFENPDNKDKFQKVIHSEEHRKNISEGLKNSERFQKMIHSEEYSKKMSEKLRNSEKWQKSIHSEGRRKKSSGSIKESWKDPEVRRRQIESRTKNVSLYNIGQNLLNKVEYEGNISKNNFINDDTHRDFGSTVIKRVIKENNITLEELVEKNGIRFLTKQPSKIIWKQKEDLGIQLSKEICGEGNIKPYYRSLHSKPDFVPLDENKPIIEVKSRLCDVSIKQYEKYQKIRKDVKIMVFDDKGKTELPQDRIMYMKEIIKSLPEGKRLVFQEKYEIIKNNIPLDQVALKDFKNKV